MRKARVTRRRLYGCNDWLVQVFDVDSEERHQRWFGRADTHAEAMFLAQLLADPHEYIRAAQERAWHGGKSVGRIQEYFKIPGPTSPYQKEDQ